MKEYKMFAAGRVIAAVVVSLAIIWVFNAFLEILSKPPRAEAIQSIAAGKSKPGVALAKAAIQTLDFEVNGRFWGWRPNDILNFTDNMNNYQLGVLEVTRKTAKVFMETLTPKSREADYEPLLAKASTALMVSPERYWFPSPESKYNQAFNAMDAYARNLEEGKAPFFNRANNLIVLLNTYLELVEDCDDKLVSAEEAGKVPVRRTQADNLVYYAKGIATALVPILEAVEKDFDNVIALRKDKSALGKAIAACRRAAEIDPIVVTESSLSGVFANHRANMAAPFTHLRLYLATLIKEVSS